MSFIYTGDRIWSIFSSIFRPWTFLVNLMIRTARTRLQQYASRIAILCNLVAYKETGLVGLPLEMLIEIMKQLEWNDVLRLRQTCKLLCKASKARPIWLCLFKKYSESTSPERFLLDKSIHKYLSGELESFVLGWKAAEVGWCVDGRVPPRERPLRMTDDADRMHLVRGGRWLLATTLHGTVGYYDLDTPESAGRQLIPNPFEEGSHVTLFMSLDMDLAAEDLPEDSSLAFNLGLLFLRHPDYNPEIVNPMNTFQQCIQVWRVTFQEDKDGEGLKAHCLSAFTEEAIATTLGFTLSGAQVAYSLRFYLNQGTSCTVVVDWALANGSQMDHPRKYISHADGVKIAFLPRHRLFIAEDPYLGIYDLLAGQLSTERPSRHAFPCQMPIWSTEVLAFNSKAISQPFFTQDSTRLVLRDPSGIRGLIVPNTDFGEDAESLPQVVSLLFHEDHRNRNPHALGYHCAVSFDLNEAILFRYRWPGENGNCGLSYTKLHASIQSCCTEEYSGRIVMTLFNFTDHSILDFPVIYYSENE